MSGEIRQIVTTDRPHIPFIPFSFSFGDTGKVLAKLPKNARKARVVLVKDTAFDAAATIDIGTAADTDKYMPTATADPDGANTVADANIAALEAADVDVIVTITGATVGEAFGFIEFIPDADKTT